MLGTSAGRRPRHRAACPPRREAVASSTSVLWRSSPSPSAAPLDVDGLRLAFVSALIFRLAETPSRTRPRCPRLDGKRRGSSSTWSPRCRSGGRRWRTPLPPLRAQHDQPLRDGDVLEQFVARHQAGPERHPGGAAAAEPWRSTRLRLGDLLLAVSAGTDTLQVPRDGRAVIRSTCSCGRGTRSPCSTVGDVFLELAHPPSPAPRRRLHAHHSAVLRFLVDVGAVEHGLVGCPRRGASAATRGSFSMTTVLRRFWPARMAQT